MDDVNTHDAGECVGCIGNRGYGRQSHLGLARPRGFEPLASALRKQVIRLLEEDVISDDSRYNAACTIQRFTPEGLEYMDDDKVEKSVSFEALEARIERLKGVGRRWLAEHGPA